ncbi:MAG: Xaa-Pro peptidase family protein [Candidatus Kryptonium sp.]
MQFIFTLLVLLLLNISACVRETPYQAPRKIKRMSAEKFFEIKKAKLDKFVLPAMKEEGIDMWIVLTREYVVDPLAMDLSADKAVAKTALIFINEGNYLKKIAICASYDVDPLQKSGIYDTVISYKKEGLAPHLKKIVEEKNPSKIALNISEDSPIADGLSASMFEYLKNTLGQKFSKRFVSSENIVIAYRSRLLPEEIEIMREAVKITEEIISKALSADVIKPGKTTEKDIANYIKKLMRDYGVGPSWEPESCPSVNAGVTRGHSEPSDYVIQRGDLITIDFGINLSGYHTDIQRTAYVLRENETQPPDYILKMWKTNVKAIEEGFKKMKPGAIGFEVDSLSRSIIVSAGYEEYPHSAGHVIGYSTHEIGPILGPNWKDRYGKKPFYKLLPGQVFALEPSVYLYSKERNGYLRIGLEEDVLITETGAEFLSTPQKELILIK